MRQTDLDVEQARKKYGLPPEKTPEELEQMEQIQDRDAIYDWEQTQ